MAIDKLLRSNKAVQWDFKFEDEFKPDRSCYTFIIDVFDQKPYLSLYRYSKVGCRSEVLQEQPPPELLVEALEKQGIEEISDGLYYINNEIKKWIEKHLLKTV